MRINKYIAACGKCSRRKADELIKGGRVTVNGKKIHDFMDIDPDADKVFLDGEQISLEKTKYYIALNKPRGFISAVSDDRERRSVSELTADLEARLYPVGRLDYNTSGLLLMTNDGDFANKVMHPRNNIFKTYRVLVSGVVDKKSLSKLASGVELEDGMTAPAKAELLGVNDSCSEVSISICEGRNRQVRRMFEALGYKVLDLKRVSIGSIKLGNLPEGKWRHLTAAEIRQLTQ